MAQASTFFSSRTLPGQRWRRSASASSSATRVPRTAPSSRQKLLDEQRASPSSRSRSGGTCTIARPRAGNRGPRGTGRGSPARRVAVRRARRCARRPARSRVAPTRRTSPSRARAAASAAARAAARQSRRGTACRRAARSNAPARSAMRAGERAALVAEQLALDEVGAAPRRSRRPRTGWRARGLISCTRCANTSFPVPVSPIKASVTSVGARRPMRE